MSNKNDESVLISFYKECLSNKFLDFDDEYQSFKINAVAKKRGIIGEGESVSKELFYQSKKLYDDQINKDRNEKIRKEKNEKRKELLSILDKNTALVYFDGKEKRSIELNKKIAELQKDIDDIEKLKGILVESYYSGSKQSHEDWFFKGLGTELATGSRALGSLAVAEANEKNRQIDEQNKQLKNQIYQKVHNDPGMNTASLRSSLNYYKGELERLETAFVSYFKNFFKYAGYKINDWEVDNEIGCASVHGTYWLRETPKMPGNIGVSLDGSCKAIIYKKADLSVLAEMLIPLPFMGLKDKAEFTGVQSGKWPEFTNKEDYGVELIDFNVCAIEAKSAVTVKEKGTENKVIADQLLFNDIKYNTDYSSIESVNKAISNVENIDTIIDEKDSFLSKVKEELKALIIKKEEEEKKAEEKRIADEKEKEIKKKRTKKGLVLMSVATAVLAIIAFVYFNAVVPKNKYEEAMRLFNNNDYEKALLMFSELQSYEDSEEMVNASKYMIAKQYINEDKYDEATNVFTELGSYKDSEEMIKESQYLKAIYLFDHSNYEEALVLFGGFDNYKDSNEYIKKIRNEQIKNAKVGDIIVFGKEETKWIVLDKKEDSILIISQSVVKEDKIDENGGYYFWETSELRKWLNSEYLKQFTNVQQERILSTVVDNPDNKEEGTIGGNQTVDKVFLLSIDEAENYFKDDTSRACGYNWWLRSPGMGIDKKSNVSVYAAYVNLGRIMIGGTHRTYKIGVRPAMWIKLNP